VATAREHGRGNPAVWSFLAARYDRDRDGKVVAAEYTRDPKAFARLDADHDGALTAKDFARPTVMDEYITELVLTRIASAATGAQSRAPELLDRSVLVASVAYAMMGGGRVTEPRLDIALRSAQIRPVHGVEDLPAGVRPFPSLLAVMDTDGSGDLTQKEFMAWGAKAKDEAATASPPPPGAVPPEGPAVGTEAPDFSLATKDGASKVTLSSFRGKTPVALILGSYTCPPFRAAGEALRRSYDRFGRDVRFFFVYLREAHAVDGRAPMPAPDQPLVEEPRTLEERREVAAACALGMGFDAFETLVDDVETNAVAKAYAALPIRLYVIGRDGKVAYRGGRGPFGFDPQAFEKAVEDAAKAK
jgi:hypothetical protein